MLATAAVLIWLTGLAHSILGERYILMRLFRREDSLPRVLGSTAFTAGTLRFVWHLITVVWWALACLVFALGRGPVSRDDVLLVVGVTALVSAAFPLYFTRGRHLSWVVFLAVGVLLLASRSAMMA
ncbi:hypothetical protein PMI14_05355 [Acidovorax sp. CF316]|nr:hypothetical protein PMI14_05355 [Acidovorax sp. CF316]